MNSAKFITADWRPEDMHYQLLAQQNIPRDFADDAVPEFVIYWMERNKAEFSWGSKFIKHVLHIWRKHEADENRASREIRMTTSWQPDAMAIDQLRSEGINDEVIRAALTDFILYWLERGDVCATWSSRFVQFARMNKARFLAVKNPSANTRDLTLVEHLTDRSWAD